MLTYANTETVIRIADTVEVTGPEFNHDWSGLVVGFRHGYVQVIDSEDDVWEVEPQHLTLEEEGA